VTAIRAASLTAFEEWPEDPYPRAWRERGPDTVGELCGPLPAGEWQSGRIERELRREWEGPLAPTLAPRDDVRVSFFYSIAGVRGRMTVENLRRALTAFGDRIERAAQCFDGKTRKPRALPGIAKGSAPHVTARALWKERDYSGALQVAESCGAAAYFGARTAHGAAPFIYMRPETIERVGVAFIVGRRVDSGRFRVCHAASGCVADTFKTCGSDKGFASGAAALAWFDAWLIDDSNRETLRAALPKTAPLSQSDERSRCEAAAAPAEPGELSEPAEPADTGADDAPETSGPEAAAETDSRPVGASTGAECADGSGAPVDAPSGPVGRAEAAAAGPLALLRYHVSGAIARGEADAIVGIPSEAAADAPEAAALAAACLARFGVADPAACRHLPAFAELSATADAAAAERDDWTEARRMLAIIGPRLTFAEDWRAEAKHQRARCGNGMPAERIGAYLALATLLDSGADTAPPNPLLRIPEPAGPPATHSQAAPLATHSQATEARECTAQFHGAEPAGISRAPGERFVRVGAPHFVYVKTSHTWAHAFWKGLRHDTPMHHTTLVRRAPAGKLNPGE
jgi:hypothetical protein